MGNRFFKSHQILCTCGYRPFDWLRSLGSHHKDDQVVVKSIKCKSLASSEPGKRYLFHAWTRKTVNFFFCYGCFRSTTSDRCERVIRRSQKSSNIWVIIDRFICKSVLLRLVQRAPSNFISVVFLFFLTLYNAIVYSRAQYLSQRRSRFVYFPYCFRDYKWSARL